MGLNERRKIKELQDTVMPERTAELISHGRQSATQELCRILVKDLKRG